MILVSGTSSGLGRYLATRFHARPFDRSASLDTYHGTEFDAIIHCAFRAGRYSAQVDLYDFFDSNTLLTHRLASLRCRKFIYLSSVDVYPRNGMRHTEADPITLTDPDSPYGVTKLLSEAIVQKLVPNHLILRVTGMLGGHIRRTTLARLLTEREPVLTLSPETITNYVNHTDVGDMISAALECDLKGIYNISASGNVTLKDLANHLGASPRYGQAFFDIGENDNALARDVMPALKISSFEKVLAFSSQVRRGEIAFVDPAMDQRR